MNKILKIILIVMLVITVGLVGAAAATGGANDIINLNLIWGYILLGLTILSALVCAVFGVINAPTGIKATLISLAVAVVVILGSYFIASGHSIQIYNLSDGSYFDADETIITEASIYVAYAVGAAVILAALGSEVMGLVEGLKKSKEEE